MPSVSIDRNKVLSLTRELWDEQDYLSLDQVDGTYFVHACIAEELVEIQARASDPKWHYQHATARLRRYLPNVPDGIRSVSVPKRPFLRDAVDLSSVNFGGRLSASGEMIRPELNHLAALAWIRLGIRNREWTGTDVAREVVKRAPLRHELVDAPLPPYRENEAMALIGAVLYREGEYGMRLYWNPEKKYPDLPPEEFDTKNRLRIRVDPNDPHWEFHAWPPMVVVSVAEPIPPEAVIAGFYDHVVIQQRQWNTHLLGAMNGQSVEAAIRTWALGLLQKSGLDFQEALRAFEPIVKDTRPDQEWFKKIPSQARFNKDRLLLVERVPEARPYLWVRIPYSTA